MSKLLYLDNAATTKTAPEVVEAMLPYFTEKFGNPSSVYSFAAANKEVINQQRDAIAEMIGAKSNEIYFTGGGSESDNWALKCTAEAYANKGNHIITTKIEHHAILHTAEYLEKRGFEVTYLDVDEDGKVKLDDLKAAIRPTTILSLLCLQITRSVPSSQSRKSVRSLMNMAFCSIPMQYRLSYSFRSM